MPAADDQCCVMVCAGGLVGAGGWRVNGLWQPVSSLFLDSGVSTLSELLVPVGIGIASLGVLEQAIVVWFALMPGAAAQQHAARQAAKCGGWSQHARPRCMCARLVVHVP